MFWGHNALDDGDVDRRSRAGPVHLGVSHNGRVFRLAEMPRTADVLSFDRVVLSRLGWRSSSGGLGMAG